MDKLTARLAARMCAFDQGEGALIAHFMKVWAFASTIGRMENLDEATQFTLESAAIVHDIAIRPLMAQYGRCPGPMQEQAGPPLARAVLEELGYDERVIRRVCALVARHHTYENVDGADCQILLEADFLVNSLEGGMNRTAITRFMHEHMKTASGRALLAAQFGLDPAD